MVLFILNIPLTLHHPITKPVIPITHAAGVDLGRVHQFVLAESSERGEHRLTVLKGEWGLGFGGGIVGIILYDYEGG